MAFQVRDIAGDASAAAELKEKYRRLAVPTIVIDGRVFVGFKDNKAVIERILETAQPFSSSQI